VEVDGPEAEPLPLEPPLDGAAPVAQAEIAEAGDASEEAAPAVDDIIEDTSDEDEADY
jgi:hypothetical protein